VRLFAKMACETKKDVGKIVGTDIRHNMMTCIARTGERKILNSLDGNGPTRKHRKRDPELGRNEKQNEFTTCRRRPGELGQGSSAR